MASFAIGAALIQMGDVPRALQLLETGARAATLLWLFVLLTPDKLSLRSISRIGLRRLIIVRQRRTKMSLYL